ncbi:hypothetical protein CMI39_03560 [Candidatus Pacearchaeota archaeon]|jgi:hypothetical protein|nr:hypothetical protein [Candidatus Pacearchaeota archaeon]|tara:strand:+ start:6503 stop:6754 length:252 start_codon:yes stop_codon:yes gene_type:complete
MTIEKYTEEDINDCCKLYSSLKAFEVMADMLIHAKNHGVEGGFNNARKEVKGLIDKLEDCSSFKELSIFSETVSKLKEVYELE